MVKYGFNVFTSNFDQLLNLDNPLQFKGGITTNADFPTSAEVENGWFYTILADVTDNDVSKTNTGQSFEISDEIAWNGTNWTIVGINGDDNYLKLDGSNANTPIDIGAQNLTTSGLGTFGNLDVDTLNFNDNLITDSTGTIDFDNENLTTTGNITCDTLNYTTLNPAIPVVTDYWKTTTAQTGLTGDKTGSFDLTTTGNLTLTPVGGAMNPVSVNQTYTSTSNPPNSMLNLSRDVTGTDSNWFVWLVGTINAYSSSRNVTGASAFIANVGFWNTTNITGIHGASSFFEQNWGLRNEATRSGTITSVGTSTMNNYGSFNTVFDSVNFNSSGNSLTINNYAAYNTVDDFNFSSPTGTLVKNYYGSCNKVSGSSNGTTKAFGVYSEVFGADTNWAYYNNSPLAGNFMGKDNVISKWGTTDTDLQIYSDGTNGIIDCGTSVRIGNATTNYTEIDNGGFLESFGSAIAWKDINLGSALLSRPSSSQPDIVSFVDETGTDTNIETYGFAVGEKVHGGFEMQHDYKEGSDFTFHVHWQGITAPSGTDNVQWRLTYTVLRDGQTLDAVTIIDSPDTPFDTQYEAVRSDFTAITGTNYNIGDQFVFTLERVAATGDAYAGDALISTAGIHYQVNTLGSRTVSAK